MAIDRRRLLGSGKALAPLIIGQRAMAAAPLPPDWPDALPERLDGTGAPPAPARELVILNRAAYGPRPGDLERLRRMGIAAWVDEQLAPDDAADTEYRERLAQARLGIEYEKRGGATVKEERPLDLLEAPLDRLWALNDYEAVPWQEMVRPVEEVRAATWLRAVYSRWQLREVLVEFWHNHFHVSVEADNAGVLVTWPMYDKVMRRNCLGNFRAFLEEVATSPAMLYYLDNASSKASPANENYARELFELHTLGAPNYLNALYDRWRDVPGALEGKPIGYIDQDVYEAARAFTGWTVADGQDDWHGNVFPDTGEFHYHHGWHDPYQKRVLGVEMDPNSPPRADGRKVLDLLAAHPGTARYVCGKLVRRLVADEPPPAIVDAAVAAWQANLQAPDQLARVVRVILLHRDFASTWGAKVKRPFEVFASFFRAVGAPFDTRGTPNLTWVNYVAGYRHFAWGPPTGHPDEGGYWLSTNGMLQRWNGLVYAVSDWFSALRFDPLAAMPEGVRTVRQMTDFWIDRLLGRPLADAAARDRLQRYLLAWGDDPDAPPVGDADNLRGRLRQLVALIGMTPDFQWR